jgi:F0F1-type ATP synthase delta subunit
MESRGHGSLLAPVLAELLTAYELAEKNATPTVIVADAKAAGSSDVAQALTSLGATTKPNVVLDDTIIGGAQVIFNHKLIDQSYKTKLHTLYKAALNA